MDSEGAGMSAAERVEQVDEKLREATSQRQKTLEKIKDVQKEIDSLVKQRMRRPREKMSELNERLAKLEKDRTIVSISVKQEKEILWQMSRVEKLKRQLDEFNKHDQTINSKKNEIASLRDELKTLGEQVSELRLELSLAQKAKDLGCSVEELLGRQVDCPSDKFGIDRVLALVDETVELPGPLLYYLTAKAITWLGEIRSRHPDVKVELTRASGVAKFRGHQDDIESMKKDIMSVNIVEQKFTVTSVETSHIVGKQGATINKLVEKTQAAIDVSRPEKEEDENDDNKMTTVVLRGSIAAVKDAMDEIEDLLLQHKEETDTVPIDSLTKEVLLMNKGVGIQAIVKLVNEGCRDIIQGRLSVSIDKDVVKVVGKSLVMPKAMEIVCDEIRLREASIVRIPIHPIAIPALIGKGGSGIKRLKEGKENVAFEIDKDGGQVNICGIDPAEIESLANDVKKCLVDHQVRVVKGEPETFQGQFKFFLRSQLRKEISELVTISRDDDACAFVCRGNVENLEKVVPQLEIFLVEHQVASVSITSSDVGVLLRGGSDSKVEEIAKQHDVRINCDSEHCLVEVIGKKENVQDAVKSIDRFLNGGDGVKVLRIAVDDASIGLLVGRGGAKKAAMEEKFSEVSISIPPNNTVVLRGPEEDVDACQRFIVETLVSSTISEKMALDDSIQQFPEENDVRSYVKSIPVSVAMEGKRISIRGSRSDIAAAVAVLKDRLGESVESRLFLDTSQFQKLQNVSRESHLARIQGETGTKIAMDTQKSSVIVSGSADNVKAAKRQLVQLLSFLLSDNFACEPMSHHSIHLIGSPNQLGIMAKETGAFLYIDRDVDSLVISSSNPEFVVKAKQLLAEKVASLNGTYYQLELGIDAEWLIPKLIGKGGSNIKELRKSLDCTVDIGDNTITLISEDPDKLASAQKQLDEIVIKERSECFYAEMSDGDMSAFMGRKGIHVQEFEKTHDVRVQSLKKKNNAVRMTGKPESVAKAKTSFEEWLQERNGTNSDTVAVFKFGQDESTMLSRLIGKNGRRINELRERCGCRIDVDVDKKLMKVTAEDADSLIAAKKIVQDVLDEERSQHVIVYLSEKDLGSFIGAKGSHVREFEKTHGVKINSLKSEAGALQISGDTEAVYKARLALDFWVSVRGTPTAGFGEQKKDAPDFDGDRRPSRTTRRDQAPPEAADFPALTNEDAPRGEVSSPSKPWVSVVDSNGADEEAKEELQDEAENAI